MGYKSNFSITSRKGRKFLYARFRDETGAYRQEVCTYQTVKAAARAWATLEFARRAAAAEAERAATGVTGELTLGAWAKRFFVAGCPHCTRLEEEGKAPTAHYRATARSIILNHILGSPRPPGGGRKAKDGTPLPCQHPAAPANPDPICSMKLSEIRRHDVLEFRSRKISSTTLAAANRAIGVLKLIMKEALFREIIQTDPTAGVGRVKYEKRERGVLSREEIGKLIVAPTWTEDGRLMFAFALIGLRTGEIRAVSWDQVDLGLGLVRIDRAVKGGAKIVVGEPKWGKTRWTPIPKQLENALRALKDQIGNPTSGSIFINPATKTLYNAHWFRDQFCKVCRVEGIDWKGRNITPHAIRHSVATLLLDSGSYAKKVQGALGWADEKVMEGYTHKDSFDYTKEREILSGLYTV